ncbi:taste receptor type 2 member 40-like [Hyperolius riggenbachi]|uniref:taste receptor type 2 member 40-like n=1 Tax=Hyperolius riggenbachi TaxID=752182 RepID=UPI0035A3A91C
MSLTLQNIFTPVLFAECLLGVTVNVFIAAVQIMKWKAVRSLDSCDQIFLCVGITRSFALTNMFLLYLAEAYHIWILKSLIVNSASVAAAFLLYFTSFWFIAVLCLFYCVKIASYNHKVFIFMKFRISRLVPWFIGTSLLISVAFSIPCVWSRILSFRDNAAIAFHGNVTVTNAGLWQMAKVNLLFIVLGCSFPFFICCGSTFLLIHSLWRHTRQMRCSGTGFRSPNIETHISVVKNMSVFLFIQVVDIGYSVSTFFTLENVDRSWNFFFIIIACAPSVFHSTHLVYSNAKLNQAFREMWHNIIRCVSIHY